MRKYLTIAISTVLLVTGVSLAHSDDKPTLYDRNKRQLEFDRGQRYRYGGYGQYQYRRDYYRNRAQDYSNYNYSERPPYPEDPDWEVYPPPE